MQHVKPYNDDTSNTELAGPEVVNEAVKVLEAVSGLSSEVQLKLETHDFGGCAIDNHGDPLPESTLKACQEADAILMGEILYYTRCVSEMLTLD